MDTLDRVARTEYENIPVGAIFVAALGQGLTTTFTTFLFGALKNAWPNVVNYKDYVDTGLGGAVAAAVPQFEETLGSAFAKAFSIGAGVSVLMPWLQKLEQAIVGPPPTEVAPPVGRLPRVATPPRVAALPAVGGDQDWLVQAAESGALARAA